ncbi:MAG TPA: tripartite tricarboxylate transporter substrate binding protein [Burkholderiales bacterium]|nr:tripartite tricarboxylate transporter substrate binding protein [Burkholderiales bacterium]
MKHDLKTIGCIAATAVMFAAGSALAAEKAGARSAEVYPNKPGRLILPFGPGGSTDVIGRIFAQRFSEVWGQTLVVDNRAGAAGIIGTELAARAPTDGHTILTYGINQAITAGLHSKLPYDHLRDFTLISLYAAMPNILCVTPSLPAANVSEFVKLAKANPGKFKYASSGIGASPHLTMELFKSVAGIDMVHIPYKNSAQGYTDTISGQIQSFFFNLPGPLPHIKTGRLRAIAVTSAKRAEQVPEIPTIMESGIPDFEVTVWQGYALPKGTPQKYVAAIHAAMMKALESADLRQRFFDAGVAAAPTTPEQFRKFVELETAKWKKAIAISGAKPE